ncbi:thioredoxin reductase [Metamycoplasma cloacale]|uniref:FAD-dependent oxidoreductase n=1 Tax=Metamycoplasma cloacale TaxID=92401 RepID=A0A2Z4LNR1_9BACT|nr:FAD-dependent oxidoreductase [Metamycoplasma cloacale]AWX42988.1 FAD-dependent oxidoreductase [Metamycoplasma cloacale]VEU79188.1 thioredoxin reductase [Metamycoplasma cloacale]
MNNSFDVIIIGAGPAGLTAALYLARNNAKVAFIESKMPGGKMAEQSKIENYPGYSFISGPEISIKMLSQAKENGAQFIYGKVIDFNWKEENKIFEIGLENKTDLIYAKAIIVATGMRNLIPLDVENIEFFNQRGVSYCAVCDGALYKGKPCAIIGGGNSAFEESAYLASMASEVHIFVRDGIIAEKKLVEDAKKHNNIFIHENSKILKLIGETEVQEIEANINGNIVKMNINCVFPYIGFRPNTEFLKNKIELNKAGFIVVDEHMETSMKNVFAAGDVIEKHVRQITTATGDGTIAAKSISNRI